MTIQQGTSAYTYPQSDNALAVVIANLRDTMTTYAPRAYMASHDAVNPFKGDNPYIIHAITVLEHTDRYSGHLPYFPQGAGISSEAYPAARESAAVIQQMVMTLGMTLAPSEHREPLSLKYLLSMFGMGQGGITVMKVTPQSIVEHYLFNTAPILVATQMGKGLRPDQSYITPIADSGLTYFKAQMTAAKTNNWQLDYYKSSKAELTTSLYADWPAIPKLEVVRLLGSYDIEAMTQFYHGYLSAKLTGADRTNYQNQQWYTRIQTLVRSAVLCQYFWSVRMLLSYPTLVNGITPALVFGDPLHWEDSRSLMSTSVTA